MAVNKSIKLFITEYKMFPRSLPHFVLAHAYLLGGTVPRKEIGNTQWQSTHLALIEILGLVKRRKKGRCLFYDLTPTGRKALDILEQRDPLIPFNMGDHERKIQIALGTFDVRPILFKYNPNKVIPTGTQMRYPSEYRNNRANNVGTKVLIPVKVDKDRYEYHQTHGSW